jgi:excisionase family DNA binding protein
MARKRQPEPLVYTAKEAAVALRVSQMHIYRLIRLGQLETLRTGVSDRGVRITRESISNWIAAKVAERKAELEAQRAA